MKPFAGRCRLLSNHAIRCDTRRTAAQLRRLFVSNTGRRRDPSSGVARRTYSTCLKTRTCAKGFFPRLRVRFPSNQPAPATGHQSQRLFTTSMEHSRVKHWNNGGATIQTRFLSYGMNRAECKVSTRQLSRRRFIKMSLRRPTRGKLGQGPAAFRR